MPSRYWCEVTPTHPTHPTHPPAELFSPEPVGFLISLLLIIGGRVVTQLLIQLDCPISPTAVCLEWYIFISTPKRSFCDPCRIVILKLFTNMGNFTFKDRNGRDGHRLATKKWTKLLRLRYSGDRVKAEAKAPKFIDTDMKVWLYCD